MRISGDPVRLNDIKKMKKHWQDVFDAIMLKCKLKDSQSVDMLRVNKLADRCERIIQAQYNVTEDWDYLESREQWNEKIKEFGGLMVTKNVETDELVYVIMDVDLRTADLSQGF